ncbi:MAG: bifunctional 1-(5-phosphoribosyl)-5-((5-phosphoribosylamino)methylideneamino)imidazole-4-carboxamide isomerase/phosphoribosylanthranilate isomerase PriA [Candidatus Nanopelagicaceae bacterium]
MRMKSLEILPAIDVKDGRAVRLVQGELAKESTYGLPVEVARDFVAQGAKWIHLVDLDAAFGIGSNFELIQQVIRSVDIQIELSGGIRDEESLVRALSTGCTRVNLGTAAIENPEWTAKVISKYGPRIAVGLDVRGHTLAARGWTKDGGDLFEMLEILDAAGCSRYIVTDVAKDGTLTGPNFELLKEVCAVTSVPVVASGGISVLQDLIDLRSLTSIGIEGAIVGKAIYSGSFTLPQALEVAGE